MMHEEQWSNPANWSRGMLYFCKDDPRLIVPKRRRVMGWTVNFGHRYGAAALTALIVLSIVAGAAAIGAQR